MLRINWFLQNTFVLEIKNSILLCLQMYRNKLHCVLWICRKLDITLLLISKEILKLPHIYWQYAWTNNGQTSLGILKISHQSDGGPGFWLSEVGTWFSALASNLRDKCSVTGENPVWLVSSNLIIIVVCFITVFQTVKLSLKLKLI